ncbi:redoxin domain-containing protein [Stieleria marina]|uniref:redoxin domain-containing protein n=1 Tax=Stieleria marina TaxID=1930275 RepID=UPI003AF3EFF4
MNVKVLRQDEYEAKVDGEKTTATMLEVILDPLAGSPPHRHPGPLCGYVIEGTFEFQVEGGPLRTLKAGDAFYEPKMILHQVGRNPDNKTRTRVLATIVHPSDAESLVILEPQHEQASLSTETFDAPKSLSSWSAKSSSGEDVPLQQLAGNPFVLAMFRGHGCYHCVEQLKALEQAEENFREQGIRIVAISSESVIEMNAALAKKPLPFTVLSDIESTLAKSLGSERIDNWHGLLIVDSKGKAHALISGSAPMMDCEKILATTQSLGLTGEKLASHPIGNARLSSLIKKQAAESPETCAVPTTPSKAAATQTTPSNLTYAAQPKPLVPDLPIVGLLIYDHVLQTEITAPSDVFSKHSEDGKQMFNVITIAASYDLIETEEGLKLFPDYTFENAPKLDVIVVPSAYDMSARVKDERLVQFIQSQNGNTKFTVSNCGGASLIGESGIAKGKKIVTWIGGGKDLQESYPQLKVQDDANVSYVEDGKFLSSNGNLASYISSLELLEKLTSKSHRKFVESYLYLERLTGWDKSRSQPE